MNTDKLERYYSMMNLFMGQLHPNVPSLGEMFGVMAENGMTKADMIELVEKNWPNNMP